mgnify:CR=1 FL=1
MDSGEIAFFKGDVAFMHNPLTGSTIEEQTNIRFPDLRLDPRGLIVDERRVVFTPVRGNRDDVRGASRYEEDRAPQDTRSEFNYETGEVCARVFILKTVTRENGLGINRISLSIS